MSDIAPYVDTGADVEWADLRPMAAWIREHRVLLGAVALIVAQLAWKAQFLSHLYFRQDDFHDLDLAVGHQFTWSYLTYIGSGHLIVGLRVIAWVLVRISSTPYNWAAASVVSLAFVAAAAAAAYRLLRDLFGDRPVILVLLAMYLLTPLTLPDLGIWSSAMESVPLQLSTFLAISAHVRYVRSGRTRHLAAAGLWIVVGMAFFEKGLVLPALLFAITAAYLTDRRTVVAGALRAFRRYWRAWLLYAVLAAVYLAILLVSLRTSASRPGVPLSARGVATFSSELLRDTFLPGAIGGPWKWFPVPGNSFSFAAPSPGLVVLSAAVAVAVIGISIAMRPTAWRAWAILAGWLITADMAPVVIGRLDLISPSVLGLETRYVADATPILIVCLGLAFLPLAGVAGSGRVHVSRRRQLVRPETARSALAAMVGLFVFGSIWSVQAYENDTNGTQARSYIVNAGMALRQVPKGTLVVQRPLPQNILVGTFGAYAYTSKVIGAMERGKLAGKVRWIREPRGTVGNLWVFGPDGRLYQARVLGATARPAAGRHCFAQRQGTVRARFAAPSSAFSGTLRFGYFLYAPHPATVYVTYRGTEQPIRLKPGLHAGYLPVTGKASRVIIRDIDGGRLCIGDVEAGNIGRAAFSQVIPPLPKS